MKITKRRNNDNLKLRIDLNSSTEIRYFLQQHHNLESQIQPIHLQPFAFCLTMEKCNKWLNLLLWYYCGKHHFERTLNSLWTFVRLTWNRQLVWNALLRTLDTPRRLLLHQKGHGDRCAFLWSSPRQEYSSPGVSIVEQIKMIESTENILNQTISTVLNIRLSKKWKFRFAQENLNANWNFITRIHDFISENHLDNINEIGIAIAK